MACFRTLPILVAILGISSVGCVESRLFQRLGFAEQEVARQRRSLEEGMDKPEKRLTWAHACKLMEANNSQLMQARESHKDVVRKRRRFVLDQLSPQMSAIANLSSALGQISGINDRNAGVRLFANINIPNPYSAYARRYSLELRYYMSALSLHELERRMKANLYAEFLRHADVVASGDELAAANQQSAGLRDLLMKLATKEQSEAQERSRRTYLRVSLNSLLNTQGENWEPDLTTLPDISYAHQLDKLDLDKGFGRLAMKQAAGQFEAALMAKWQVEADRLPDFNTGVAMPTLYDSQIDEEGFDADQTRLFFNLSKAFDLSGREAERARDAEKRIELLQENLESRMEREVHRLKGAKERYRMLVREQQLLDIHAKWMNNNPPDAGSPSIVIQRVRDMLALREQSHRNEMMRRQLDLEFWIWDENYWKSPF